MKSSSGDMNGRQRLVLYIFTVCAAALLCLSVYSSDRTATKLGEPGSVAGTPRPLKSASQRSVQHAGIPPVLLIPQPGANDSTSVLTTALDYTSVFHQVYHPHGYTACPPPKEGQQPCWLQLAKEVDCAALFDDYQKVLETHVPVFPAPRDLPHHLRDEFLLYNFTQLSTFYFPQLSHAPNAEVPVWTNETLQEYLIKAKARVQVGGYNKASLPIYQALDCHPVQGLTGAVFGTEKPWLEGLLFGSGSGHITTIEFRTTVSHIPNHRVIKPLEWVQGLKAGTLPNVDYAFSFSSWEHDGLGRYGDPIDPWGDVKAVQRASCYVKPGGILYFAGPSSAIDQIMYNAHRIYGPVRLPLLTANWEVLGVYDDKSKTKQCGSATCDGLFSRWREIAPLRHYEYQPVVVLLNVRTTPCSTIGGTV